MADATNSAPLFNDTPQIVPPLYDVPGVVHSLHGVAVEKLAQAILENRVKINVAYGWTGDTRSVTSFKIVVYPSDV
jgi:hypothetical protein